MSSLLRNLRRESGQAMMMVVFVTALLSVLAVGLSGLVTSETQASGHSVSSDGAYQAAESGVDAYAAYLLDDQLYYLHYVAPGESTRVSGALTVSPGTDGSGTDTATAWTGGILWTYPSGQNHWHVLGNGYAYNLEITAPSGSATAIQQAVQIVSTGCRWNVTANQCGTAANNARRTIQTLLVPSSVANFQMISNQAITYLPTATTNGRIYSTKTLTHNGVASGDLFSEVGVLGTPTLLNGATKYSPTTTPNIRSVIKNPIDFSSFLTSITDIQRASQNGGVYLHQASAPAAWELVFNANGTFTAAPCSMVGSSDVAAVAPTCGTATTYNVPSNGAIYSNETVIIGGTGSAASVVNGRVTVTSNNNVVIGNNITYQPGTNSVLGLVALNNMIVAYWAPFNLTWWAATITTTGYWADACQADGVGCAYPEVDSHGNLILDSSGHPIPVYHSGTMTFNGSTATNAGGTNSLYASRIYNYDPNLLWLTPPWFPTLSKPYTVLFERELTGQ